ncbi:hypothetical protein [Rhizobium leguminosarum]|uniref:hypothetical protein n=1 Tax=Rhizobium leguminosarum TaxID=384 RepID=UPI002E15A074|nr:hypothetical protein U8Q02_40080 [Rhizobium leguminosarum]
MGLSRYGIEVGGIANELGELLRDHDLEDAAFSVLTRLGEEAVLDMAGDAQEKALKFLSRTPSQRDKAILKMGDEDAALLILRARYLGLSASRAIFFADGFEFVVGQGYRDAAENCARKALRARLYPLMTEVLPGWGEDNESDLDDDMDDDNDHDEGPTYY